MTPHGMMPSPPHGKRSSLSGGIAIVGLLIVLFARAARPLPDTAGPMMLFLAGVLPNFGAGLALPNLGMVVVGLLTHSRPQARRVFAAFALGAIVLLVSWEFVELHFWSIPFDLNDIFASVAGVMLAWILYIFITDFF